MSALHIDPRFQGRVHLSPRPYGGDPVRKGRAELIVTRKAPSTGIHVETSSQVPPLARKTPGAVSGAKGFWGNSGCFPKGRWPLLPPLFVEETPELLQLKEEADTRRSPELSCLQREGAGRTHTLGYGWTSSDPMLKPALSYS